MSELKLAEHDIKRKPFYAQVRGPIVDYQMPQAEG
jgi:hypothetical protein